MTKALLLGVLCVGCGPTLAEPSPEPPSREPPDVRFERDMMVRFHMHQNFDLLRGTEKLLIRGKLDEARLFAMAIATAPDEPGHSGWAAHTTRVRERAAAVAAATEVPDALRKIARVGAACGNCHGEHAIKLGFEATPRLPVDAPSLEARMARHRWAADRLWEGLVGNAESEWRAGLDVLAATPLPFEDERGYYARDLQRKADQARRPSPGPIIDRGTTYGELLVTCVGCHTRRKPDAHAAR